MRNRLNNSRLSQFYQDLALFVHSGLTVERGLALLKKGKSGPYFYLLDGLQFHINQGGTLWEGMTQAKGYFSDFQVMTIKAGEESGHLIDACDSLSKYFALRHQEKKRLIGSLIYPLVLLHGVILLPPLKYLFLDNLGKSYWSVVLPPLLIIYGLGGLLYILWNTYFQSGRQREIMDEFLLSIPIIGKLIKAMSYARVFRAIASMYNAGIENVRSAAESIRTAGNKAIERRLNAGIVILEKGGTYADFFSFTGALSPLQQGMIAVGEQTGTLGDSLDKIVSTMEYDYSVKLERTIKMTGALIYIIAATVVAITVISFYSQYFSIN